MSGELRDGLGRLAGPDDPGPAVDGLWRRGRAVRRRRRVLSAAAAVVVVVALAGAAVALAGGRDTEGVVAGPDSGTPPPEEPDLPVAVELEAGPTVDGTPTLEPGGDVQLFYVGADEWTRGTSADWEAWDGDAWRVTHVLTVRDPERDAEGGVRPVGEDPGFSPAVGRSGSGPDVFPTPADPGPGWYRVCVEMGGPPGTGAPLSSSTPATSRPAGSSPVGSALGPEGQSAVIRPCAQVRVLDPDAPPEAPDPTETVVGAPIGDEATWVVDPAHPVDPATGTVSVLVTRTGCASGETGEVLRPHVVLEDDEIVVTFSVAAIGPGGHTCPGNDAVPYELDLGQPVGDRTLVDGRDRSVRYAPPG